MELNFTLVSDDLSDCVCKFWNETTGKLEETGVITSTHDGHVICKTDHLTSFVVVRATHVPGSGKLILAIEKIIRSHDIERLKEYGRGLFIQDRNALSG